MQSFRRTQEATKHHLLMDFDGCLPIYINLSDGKLNDAKAAKEIILPAKNGVVADRTYIDFRNLYRWHKTNSYFIIRLKKSTLTSGSCLKTDINICL
ncbi:transposase [Geofilum sp. OHC36d9]|uniref:transposase n=1 Tax=Geofilum sp. OHC36d9 TaxID=3458413 RepID=UPI0040334280